MASNTVPALQPASLARRLTVIMAVTGLFLAAVLLLAPLVGSTRISLPAAFAGQSPDAQIYFGVRWPRAILAALAGGALALSGALFQALLRDALATPYTLGVSSGASLGAVLAISFRWGSVAGVPMVWIAAMAGAMLTLALVAGVAVEGRRMSSFTLLLAGVTINSIVMSVIMVLHNLASVGQSFAIVHWLMGGVEPLSAPALAALAAVVLPISAAVCWKAREWNLLAVGEEWATARGVSPRRLLMMGYLAGSLLTATVTSVTGPIGFVGLIVPHALRLKTGADHRLLMPASFLAGAAFLVLCDTAARTAMSVEIPVSVVTALVGGPFFIALLRSRRKSLWL
ncbi:MAG TPA: iron ABC transporter permease [Bryobacteraceae bacterium]|nr:iron ABC transporter permease [Bryobacteraceae bacterium]